MCGYRARIGYKYRVIPIKLIVVEKWVAWKNVLDLRTRALLTLNYKNRMNLDGG